MGKYHEHYLLNELDILKEQGYRIIHASRRIPDAVVVAPDGKVIAVEILSRTKRFDARGRSKGYRWNKKMEDKKWNYGGFDDILFVLFSIPDEDPMKRVWGSERWPDLYKDKEWLKEAEEE